MLKILMTVTFWRNSIYPGCENVISRLTVFLSIEIYTFRYGQYVAHLYFIYYHGLPHRGRASVSSRPVKNQKQFFLYYMYCYLFHYVESIFSPYGGLLGSLTHKNFWGRSCLLHTCSTSICSTMFLGLAANFWIS